MHGTQCPCLFRYSPKSLPGAALPIGLHAAPDIQQLSSIASVLSLLLLLLLLLLCSTILLCLSVSLMHQSLLLPPLLLKVEIDGRAAAGKRAYAVVVAVVTAIALRDGTWMVLLLG